MNSRLIQGRAPAKINLHLRVLNRRPDGYHNIFSVFSELVLADILKLSIYETPDRSGMDISIRASGGKYAGIINGIETGKNLIHTAVNRYLSNISGGGTYSFDVEKNIPSGAGLGGGSSDAACAIELMRQVLGRNKDGHYFSAAAHTGSDVPYFLTAGNSFVTGTGEKVENIDFKCGHSVILVNNGIHIDTGAAYKSLGRTSSAEVDESGIATEKALITGSLKDVSAWKKIFVNDFEKVIFPEHPEIAGIKDEMYALGADYSAMTGSGSTVFGVFSDAETAKKASAILQKENNVIFTKFAC